MKGCTKYQTFEKTTQNLENTSLTSCVCQVTEASRLSKEATNWRATDPLPGSASGRSPTTYSGLAAGAGKGGDATGRMASTPLIAGRSPRNAHGNVL